MSSLPALALALVTSAFAATSSSDQLPPSVLVLSAESQDGQLEVNVRVVDPSGPGEVLFHVRGPKDGNYRIVPMSRLDGDLFRVRVPFGGGADDWLAYYVEATDRQGTGPGLNGSAEEPFHSVPTEAIEGSLRDQPWAVALFLVPPLFLLFLVLYQPGRRRREEQFWVDLLASVSAKPADGVEQAIADLCAVRHPHPARGLVSVKPKQARRWLERLKTTRAERLKQARDRLEQNARPRPTEMRSLADADEDQIRDELFWFHMLRPLVESSSKDANEELRRLAARRHFHPEHGWRIYDAGVLRAQLDQVRRVDPKALFDVARLLDNPPRPQPVETTGMVEAIPSGASLVELVVILALFGALLGMTALALQPLEAPVQVSGELTEALLRQARARSIARTSVHRVRPLDVDSLIVESSSNCGSSAWSLEDDMTLDLPEGVTLSGTAWAVCFDSRGIASDNVVVTFNHPEFADRQLEVLQGGTTRWLP